MSASGVAGSVSAIGRRRGLVAADEELHGVPVRLADGLEGHRGVVGVGRLEARRRVEIGRAGAGRARPQPPSRERVPEERLVRAPEADHVGREHGVTRVDHAHRPARHQQPGVEHELRPAPVPRALGDRQVTCEARLLEPDVPGRERVVVRLDQRLADVVVRRRPDLAVSMHLRALRAGAALVAGEVVAHVRVVERARVHAVVADARDLVAGDVWTDGERVLVGNRDEPLRVEELGRSLIRPALAHRAGLIPRETGVRPGDHAVRDHVRVLVCDHGHVVVAVDAWPVEARRNRLPEEHVRHRHDAVGRENWFALSRDANPGGPPTMPPA